MFTLQLILTLWLVQMSVAADRVFLEKEGLVAIEVESTPSRLGSWKKKTDVADFSGECHFEFTGNKLTNGPPEDPLKYHFKITKPGNYALVLRARKRLENEREDLSNDCYVAMKGDFTSGGKAPLEMLQQDTKMFGGNADTWGWARSLDSGHKKFPAIYNFKTGETYQLTISGRSKNFNLDRFILVHESLNVKKIQSQNPTESLTENEEEKHSTSLVEKKIKRKLTDNKGRSIEATLLSKNSTNIEIEVNSKRHSILISSLSEADQKFIADWEP